MRPSKRARMVASGTASRSSPSVPSCHRAAAGAGMSGRRQLDGERAARTGRALAPDRPAEQLDQLAGDVQAEARPLAVDAAVAELLEGLEQPGLVGDRDPDAGVDHVDGHDRAGSAAALPDDEPDAAPLGE